MLCSSHDVVSIEFLATGMAHAESLGRPGLAIVAIPDPGSGISEDDVRRRARGAVDAITFSLIE